MIDKYLDLSMQRLRILMRKLNGMVMMPNQNPDEHLTEAVQQRDESEHICESFTEARILDLILEGLSKEYELIQSATEREIEPTLLNMYANRVARGGGSTFLNGKVREPAMTASSHNKGSSGYGHTPGHN